MRSVSTCLIPFVPFRNKLVIFWLVLCFILSAETHFQLTGHCEDIAITFHQRFRSWLCTVFIFSCKQYYSNRTPCRVSTSGGAIQAAHTAHCTRMSYDTLSRYLLGFADFNFVRMVPTWSKRDKGLGVWKGAQVGGLLPPDFQSRSLLGCIESLCGCTPVSRRGRSVAAAGSNFPSSRSPVRQKGG